MRCRTYSRSEFKMLFSVEVDLITFSVVPFGQDTASNDELTFKRGCKNLSEIYPCPAALRNELPGRLFTAR